MKRTWFIAATATFLSPSAAYGQPQPSLVTAGEEYEVRSSYKTSQLRKDGNSSSSGHDTLLERVLEVRADGVELEFDLPKDATADERAREWKFPARVFKPSAGTMRLLNQAELEARLEKWLKAAEWSRAVCGRWIFTWNAFRIDCDPQSVIKIIQAYDLTSVDLRHGASYHMREARTPGTLQRKSIGPNGSTFSAVMEIDPEAVRNARAESDVAVGEIMGKPVTLEAALQRRTMEVVSGTVSVTFETDSSGRPRRRTTVTKLVIKSPGSDSETSTATETVERHLVSAAARRR